MFFHINYYILITEEEIPINKKVETVTPTFNNHQYSSSSYQYDNMQPMMMDDYDDLMPDPMQFVSLMGAPPPPPMVPPPIIEEDPVLPPGINLCFYCLFIYVVGYIFNIS